VRSEALAEEGWSMNIGKKLYISFGVILATVLVLLIINLMAVQREHDTKTAAQRSIDMAEATSSVRFEMMQNRLHLQNYLLSGDTRDV
jgi:CHASE3 domain sensor protein